MLLRYTQESAQPFIYKGYALFISKLEIADILVNFNSFSFIFMENLFIYDNSDMQKKGGTNCTARSFSSI